MATTRNFRWLLLTLAALACTLDLGSKYGMFRWLFNGDQPAKEGAFEAWTVAANWQDGKPMMVMGGRYNLVPGWMGLTAAYPPPVKSAESANLNVLQSWSAPRLPHVNHGALFGLGGEHEGRANLVFAGVSLVAAIGILVWGLKRINAVDWWLSASLGLILGGTLGNLFDRLVFGGVRDFLYFYHSIPIVGEWPVFNVADSFLLLGAAMLLVQAFFGKKKPVAAATSVEAVAATR